MSNIPSFGNGRDDTPFVPSNQSDKSPVPYNPEFHKNCFFIFDDLQMKDERAKQEELLLFFYPQEVPLEKKTLLMGGCSSMIFFTRNFTNEPVTILKCQKFQAAVRTLEHNVFMVLTAPATEAQSVVQIQLDRIAEAFHFFNGSYTRIREMYKDSRKNLLTYMERVCNQLIPLVVGGWMNNLMKPFGSLLTWVDLPNRHKRHFLTATQILNGMQEISEKDKDHGVGINYGGCILFSTSQCSLHKNMTPRPAYSILTTQLDLITTRCIVSRVEFLRSNKTPNNINWAEQTGATEAEVSSDEVYLSEAQISRLKKTNVPLYGFDPVTKRSFTTDSESESETESMRSNRSGSTEVEYVVGLCIISINDISLAFICSRDSLLNPKHINKTKVTVEPKLDKLERDLKRAIYENPTTQKLLNKVKIPRQVEEGRASWYHFMIFDNITQSAFGSSYAPTEPAFISQLSDARNVWNENSEICQVVLRDHKNGIFARRVNGKEVFFQPNSASPHSTFLRHIERAVYDALNKHRQINLH